MKSELTTTSTRRDWIRSAGAMALAVATPGWLVAGPAITPSVAPPSALDAIDLPMAQSLIGQQFEMVSAEGHAICVLAGAEAVGNSRGSLKSQKSFAMEFRPITRHGNLQQDTFLVQHAALGTFDLFLVPHTNDRGETLLVATFSRL